MPFKDKSRYQSEEYKEYQRNYQRAWHQRNKARRLAKIYARRAAIYEYIHSVKEKHYCADCGQQHPATLQFHHINAESKAFNIGDAIRDGIGFDRIKAEIDKCIVLCANCHAIRHYNMRNKDKNGSDVAAWFEKFLTPDPEDIETNDD